MTIHLVSHRRPKRTPRSSGADRTRWVLSWIPGHFVSLWVLAQVVGVACIPTAGFGHEISDSSSVDFPPVDASVAEHPSESKPALEAGSSGQSFGDVVLPGYDSIAIRGTLVELGDRRYEWSSSFLPTRVESEGRSIAGPIELVARVGDRTVRMKPDSVRVVEATPAHARIVAEGEPVEGLSVVVDSRIEYDGVVVATIRVRLKREIRLDLLTLEATVRRFPASRVLAFDARTIRRKDLAVFEHQRYDGPLINVFGFPDGESSFWLFTEDASGWKTGSPSVTSFEAEGTNYRVRHHIVGRPIAPRTGVDAEFGFLATPIRSMPPAASAGRVVSRMSEAYRGLGKFHLWWTTALAHQDAPFLTLPEEASAKIPDADHRAYPGVAKNRELLRRWRRLGIERLPYFSGHALSELDPALREYRAEWEVSPRQTKRGDAPFVAEVERPWLSHRASGYTDYMLDRWDSIIDALGIRGVYFDQGRVIDSNNPSHGGWVRPDGVREGSLDILGNRAYLKRLRTLFHEKGLPGFLFTHVSGVEIVPAYTFATSIVVGENFRGRIELRGDDYVSSLKLDDARALFSSHQYGLPVTWLPQLWNKHRADPDWKGSASQRRGLRSLLALALLHDTLVWPPADWPIELYAPVLKDLDRFAGEDANFIGYWSDRDDFVSDHEGTKVSYYLRGDRALVILSNLGSQSARVRLRFDRTVWRPQKGVGSGPMGPSSVPGGVELQIDRHDFRMIEMERVEK